MAINTAIATYIRGFMLLPGYSRTVVRSNIRQLCRETNCRDTVRHGQNVAIALDTARAYFRQHGSGPLPKHLVRKRRKARRR